MGRLSNLVPGDLVIAASREGLWAGAFEYVGPDDNAPGRLLVRDRSNGAMMSADPAILRVPVVRAPEGQDEDAPAPEPISESAAAPTHSAMGHGITAAQRRKLFVRAKAIGMDIDDLRAATPMGSISALSCSEAAALIDRLEGYPGRSQSVQPGQGTATGKQLGMIAYLRGSLGFTEAQFAEWLTKRFQVSGIGEITDRSHASKIIGGLLKMQQNILAGRGAGQNPTRPPSRGTGSGG